MSETYRHGYRIRIYPTEAQKEIIHKLIDAYRFAYNWGKSIEEEQYRKKKNGEIEKGFLSYFELTMIFKQFRDLPENAWLRELPLATARRALKDAVQTFKDFFHRGCGYPKFKSKKRSPKMFKTRNDRFYIDGDKVRFEGLDRFSKNNISVDSIDLHHDFGWRKSDKIKYAEPSISLDDFGQYWVSFSIEESTISLDKPKSEPIGIDVGIRKTMALSTREVFNRPNDKIKRLEKRLRYANRHYNRDINRRRTEANRTKTKYEDVPVSNRAEKRADKVRKLYKKITNVKLNWYHNTIKEIVTRNPECIVIETLQSREIERGYKRKKYNRSSRHTMHTANLYTMHKIIEDKCNKYGIKLIKADKEYPSSQICSTCGYQQDIGRHKVYKCPICGTVIDRDYNAALNLRNLAYVA